jgi:SAM-dependent methyltransferase
MEVAVVQRRTLRLLFVTQIISGIAAVIGASVGALLAADIAGIGVSGVRRAPWIGCGTGSLAIAAKRSAGLFGSVYGIDASPEMIARARKKARKAGVDVTFTNGVVDGLPFPDEHFDAVLSRCGT